MTTPNDTPIQAELPFTINIPLTRGYSTVVDAIDADLAKVKWQVQIAPRSKYATRVVFTSRTESHREMLHRLILERMLDRKMIKGECVDHINGDGLDNRRENLRLATHAQNMHNSQKPINNSSGYKGVDWSKGDGKWRARIAVNGKRKGLGLYNTPEAAHEAYQRAAKELHGEFFREE
jgi:hypothetical protein